MTRPVTVVRRTAGFFPRTSSPWPTRDPVAGYAEPGPVRSSENAVDRGRSGAGAADIHCVTSFGAPEHRVRGLRAGDAAGSDE